MRRLQAGLALLFVAFFLWYTPLRGPLGPEEIDGYLARLAERDADPAQLAALRAFLEADTGDDFVMVNAIEMREPPLLVGDVREGESAREVLDRYMAFMWPALLRRACHPVVVGWTAAPALDVWGIEDATTWSQAGLMRYRSRRDMMEVATDPGFGGSHAYKLAAMAKTVAFPLDPWLQLGDPRLVLGLACVGLGLGAEVVRARRGGRAG